MGLAAKTIRTTTAAVTANSKSVTIFKRANAHEALLVDFRIQHLLELLDAEGRSQRERKTSLPPIKESKMYLCMRTEIFAWGVAPCLSSSSHLYSLHRQGNKYPCSSQSC